MSEILNLSLQWAKTEMVSAKFFIVAALLFIVVSGIFWQFGKTELAKAYIWPMLVCGILLMIVGVGLVYSNYTRFNTFTEIFNDNPIEFLHTEIERATNTAAQFKNVVLKVIPILIVIAALVMFFINKPTVMAICVSAILMLTIILLIDGNSYTRIDKYNKALQHLETKLEP